MQLFSGFIAGNSGRRRIPRFKNSATTTAASAGGTEAITMPSDILAGNLLVMSIVAIDTGGGIDISVSGWTELDEETTGGSSVGLYYKIAAGSDTATATLTGGASDFSALVGQFEFTSGVNGTPTSATNNSGDATASAVTTTEQNCLVIGFGAVEGAATVSTPSGFTLDASYTSPDDGVHYIFSKLQAATGSTGTVLFNQSGSGSLAVGQIAIKP